MINNQNRAVLVGGAVCLIGLGAVYGALQIPRGAEGGIGGARIFPYLASGAILIFGALEFHKGIRGTDKTRFALTKVPFEITSLLALAIAYVLLITKLGYLIATGLVVPAALLLFGVRNPLGLLAAMVICPVVYQLIFFELLGVFPPFGEWFDLLDVIQGF